jgi:uncharacterized cupredoxin-like copper-binding protein
VKSLLTNKTTIFAVTLVLLAGLIGACSGGSPGRSNSSNNTTNTANSAVATTVNVTTTEMSFAFDPMPTRAGKITFVVTNNGKIEHNFVVQGNGIESGTKMIPPGGSQSITLDLAPGTYDFVCGVFGHAIAGMRGSFTLS